MIRFLGDSEKRSLVEGINSLIRLKKLSFFKSNGKFDLYLKNALSFNEMQNIFDLIVRTQGSNSEECTSFISYILSYRDDFLNLKLDLNIAAKIYFYLIYFDSNIDLYSETILRCLKKYSVFDKSSFNTFLKDLDFLSTNYDEFFESIVDDENYDVEEYWEVAEEFESEIPYFDHVSKFFNNILLNNRLIKNNYMIFSNFQLSEVDLYKKYPNLKLRYSHLFNDYKLNDDGAVDEDEILEHDEQAILHISVDDINCNFLVEDYISCESTHYYEFYYSNEFYCDKHAYWVFSESCLIYGTKKHLLILMTLVLLRLL
ncbi:hypothetical protein [Clostridium baratii]|uniref:hypothetical protein n=1 Tax=Clostridium baratii TaxID=1561 RepID=UPI0005F2B904|nr:hypothetical protein [Clostridium baratii]KJU71556.1 hypothetical protein UC77_09080 [Clostridium baratii]